MKTKTPAMLAIITLVTIATIMVGCGSGTTAAPKVGDKAPDFTLQAIDGKNISLSDFKGKPVMVIFQKTMNCPGCIAQKPFVLAAYGQRKNKDLVVITIFRGDGVDKVKNFVPNLGWDFPALADPQDEVGKKFGFSPGAPISVFIDANGIITAEKVGPFQSKEEITAILDSL